MLREAEVDGAADVGESLGMKPGTVAVVLVAIALVVGGLFFGLGGSPGREVSTESIPRATLPPSTVAPPAPAVIEGDSQPEVAPPQSVATGAREGDTLPVPNVIGVSQATAEARLAAFEVAVTTTFAVDPDFFDAVSAQSPAAAERLPAGATVTITLSVQPSPDTIPAEPVLTGELTTGALGDLDDGDCANGSLVDSEFVYELIDCDEFHDVQLVSRFVLENAPDEYDSLALAELVRDQCEVRFEEFVGVESRDSQMVFKTARPEREAYESENDRVALCVLTPNEQVRISGSALDSLW